MGGRWAVRLKLARADVITGFEETPRGACVSGDGLADDIASVHRLYTRTFELGPIWYLACVALLGL